jgi:hypothetical protein
LHRPDTGGIEPSRPDRPPLHRKGIDLTAEEEAQIRQLNEELRQDIVLRLRLTDDHRSKAIHAFGKRLSGLVPAVRLLTDEEDTGLLPAILIGPRMRFCGVPTEQELAPFLDAVKMLGGRKPDVPESIRRKLTGLQPPAELQLFVAPFCHFCPKVFRQVLPLPFAFDSVHLTVVDGMLFEDAARKENIRSVPTFLLDNQYRWTGSVSLDELSDAVVQRDPSKVGRAVLERMLSEGAAFELARLMVKHGRVFESFCDLLASDNFTLRLAAMAAMEEIVATDLLTARSAADLLWERFERAPQAVKGDILYILGELRSAQTRSRLREVLDGDFSADVREAALEAIEKIDRE